MSSKQYRIYTEPRSKKEKKRIIFRGKARENKYAKFKEVFRFLKTE